MKTIGLLGGLSWQSTVGYYRVINEGVKRALGGLHSAKIAMVSVDFDPIAQLQKADDWEGATHILCEAAQHIEAAGADFLLICTNTMHKVAPQIASAITIPILHIADATAEALLKRQIHTVGLLGTAFTMEQPFYKDRLKTHHGIDVLIPGDNDRRIIHDIIYNELCLGEINPASRKEYLRIVASLAEQGAEGVVLACTEIGLLIGPHDTGVSLFDTALIHAEKAVELALR